MGMCLNEHTAAGRYNGRRKDDPTRIRQCFGITGELGSFVGFRAPTDPCLITWLEVVEAINEHTAQITCNLLEVLHVLGSQQCINISHDALIVIVSIKAHCTGSGLG